MTKLVIKNLACHYGGQAVIENLSFSLENNEIIALIGPSGCGKTTLLRAIAGLQTVQAGEILFDDRLVSSAKVMVASEKRNIGMIFQDYALFPHLNVIQNIAFGLANLDKKTAQSRINTMLKLVKLTGFASRFPHELSGGQQQRVAIARALAYQPDLMLLDEPFSNIDSQSRSEIMIEIRQIFKQQNVPAVFVTHSKDEAFTFADKIAIFNHGKIEQIGTAQQLYLEPISAYVANFMGKANYLPITAINGQSITTLLGDIKVDTTYRGHHRVAMLRPEQLHIKKNSDSSLVIEHSTFSGSHWVHRVADPLQATLQFETHCTQAYPVGTPVSASVAPHSLVTFEEA